MIHQLLSPYRIHPKISLSLRLLVLCLVCPDLFVIFYCLFLFFKELISFMGSLDKSHTSILNALILEGNVNHSGKRKIRKCQASTSRFMKMLDAHMQRFQNRTCSGSSTQDKECGTNCYVHLLYPPLTEVCQKIMKMRSYDILFRNCRLPGFHFILCRALVLDIYLLCISILGYR